MAQEFSTRSNGSIFFCAVLCTVCVSRLFHSIANDLPIDVKPPSFHDAAAPMYGDAAHQERYERTPHNIADLVQPLNTGSFKRFIIRSVSPGSRCRNQHRGHSRRAANEKAADEHVRNIAKLSMRKHPLETHPDGRDRTPRSRRQAPSSGWSLAAYCLERAARTPVKREAALGRTALPI